jgi:hypothetical protein
MRISDPAIIAFRLLSVGDHWPTEHFPETNILRPGTVLVEQGKHVVDVHLIHQGTVELTRGNVGSGDVVIGQRSQGCYTGGLSAILKTRSPYSVRTKSSCRTTQLPATKFVSTLIQNPIMMWHFTCSVCLEIDSRADWIAPNVPKRGVTRFEPTVRAPSVTPDHLSKLIHDIYFRELSATLDKQGNRRPESWVATRCSDAVGQEAMTWADQTSVGCGNGWQTRVGRMSYQELRLMDPTTFTKEKAIAWYWEFAQKTPEEMRGSLKYQIEACKQMYALGHEPALARLRELANIDAARTKGRRQGQEAAAKFLKRLPSIEVEESQKIRYG